MLAGRRLLVLVNPSAHSRRACRHLQQAGLRSWQESRSPGHLAELVRTAQDEEVDAIVLAGGDGTVALAVNALERPNRVPLALLPVGSGNDFARQLGMTSLRQALAVLRQGKPGQVDVGRVGRDGPRFCCVASVGLDEMALRFIHGSWLPRSKALNILSTLLALCVYRTRPVRVQWQGGGFEGEVVFVAVTNTRSYGGGFQVSPQARLEDGLLDLCIIQRMPRPRLLWQMPRILHGSHGVLPEVILASSPWVRIDAREPLPVALDGELPRLSTPIELHVEPGFLQVLRPSIVALREEVACRS